MKTKRNFRLVEREKLTNLFFESKHSLIVLIKKFTLSQFTLALLCVAFQTYDISEMAGHQAPMLDTKQCLNLQFILTSLPRCQLTTLACIIYTLLLY
jgi:hypothetical protein